MKVAFASFDSAGEISGVSSWLLNLLPELHRAGIEPEAHLFRLGDGEGANEQALQDSGIKCRSARWPNDTRLAIDQCVRWVREFQPNTYVPNCVAPAYFAAAFLRRDGIRSVAVLHSDDSYYHGIVDEFVAGRTSWRVDAVVAVSRYLESAVRTRIGRAASVARIPCGIPIPPAPTKPRHQTLRLVWTGRMVEEQKCVSATAAALARALETWPDIEVTMLGDGAARRSVERILQPYVTTGRARLPGRLSPREVRSNLAEQDVFVLLSDYEGLPVSLLEAMAAEVAPVCLRTRSGVDEVIKSGTNGLMVNSRDDDFLHAIGELRSRPDYRSSLAKAARESVSETFSIASCAEAWAQVLHTLPEVRRGQLVEEWYPGARLPAPNPQFGQFETRQATLAQRVRRKFRRWMAKRD